MQMFALPFEYRQKEYHSVVRVKQRNEEVKLEVTILNGDLGWKLHGYNVFTFQDGCINCTERPQNNDVKELQLQVEQAIHQFVREHSLPAA